MRASAERVAVRYLSRVAGRPSTWAEVVSAIDKVFPSVDKAYRLLREQDPLAVSLDRELRGLSDFLGNGAGKLWMWKTRREVDRLLGAARRSDPTWFDPARYARILDGVSELSGDKAFVRNYKAFWKVWESWTAAGYPMP